MVEQASRLGDVSYLPGSNRGSRQVEKVQRCPSGRMSIGGRCSINVKALVGWRKNQAPQNDDSKGSLSSLIH